MKPSNETQIATTTSSVALEIPSPPRAICEWMAKLADEGHSSHLVSECVLQLALQITPTHFFAQSSIGRESLLGLAPRAIPTGVQSGAITIPTAGGPLVVLPERGIASGPGDPVSSSFAILNLAFDPIQSQLIAPPQTLRDVASRTLDPREDAPPSADPAFALEAARLVAAYDLSPTASLLDRARKTRFEATPQSNFRMRRLIRDILLAPHPRAGLRLLRDSGAEALLVPGVREHAPELVAQVPATLRVRLLAWLVDADARSLLRTLRFGGQFSADLYRLFDHHPIDACAAANHDGEVGKLLGRLSRSEIEDLLSVRRAEIHVLRESDRSAEADRIAKGLDLLLEAFARVREKRRLRERRTQLAIRGADVMRALDCGPGPGVGRAIRHLERSVEIDPECNTRERLLAELARWRNRQ